MNQYVLHIIEGCEIPKGNIVVDINYFDRDSLERMYGVKAVQEYLKGIYEQIKKV